MKGCLFQLILTSLLLAHYSTSALAQSSPESSYDCAGIPNGTTQVTDCGCGKPAKSTYACGACGDNTSCLDCAGTPYGGRVPSGPIGGVPGADACTLVCPSSTVLYPPENRCLSTADACSRVDANLINVGMISYHPKTTPSTNSVGAVWRRGEAAFTTFAGIELESSCVASALRQCLPIGQAINYMLTARRQAGNNNDADKCVGNIIRSWGVAHTRLADRIVFGVTTEVWAGYAYVKRQTSQGCGPAPADLIALAISANCNVRSIDTVEFHSPVSLLWSDGVEIDSIRSFSSFPLSGKNEGKTFEWRASGMTPLVVYDSQGLGEIKDATQLFGNHTFGKEWKNGYDALAALDIDKSGWLEGEELNAVALWFDFNQDGVSQKGEVKRLSDTGVFAIGVKSDSVDEKTKNIFASAGFKRRVEGKEIIGRSVDWFGGIAKGRVPARAAAVESSNASGTSAAAAVQAAALEEIEKIDLRTTVSGVWEWRITDDKTLLPEQQPGGYLALTQEGAAVRGQSVSTVGFLPNMYEIDEKVTAIPLSGSFGSGEVRFKIKGEKSPLASSSAKLSADGMTLMGSTTEEVPVKGGSAQVTFAWQARRLIRDN